MSTASISASRLRSSSSTTRRSSRHCFCSRSSSTPRWHCWPSTSPPSNGTPRPRSSVIRSSPRSPNPIVVGGIAGLFVSVLGVMPPAAVMSPLKMLGDASVPAALLAFGLSLTGVQVFKKGESPRRDIALAAALKMVVMPLTVYAIARWGFGQTGEALFAQVVIAALPTAQNVLVYATRYRRGQILARDTALITTLASIPAIAVIALLLA
ncbi:AEC family transporter [Gordonia amicalis]|nr:AEC family transporter [Gordonia amicalis]UKO93557.1 AEC family transporter [Gordonia amicalis]